jgi:hypothetical protein
MRDQEPAARRLCAERQLGADRGSRPFRNRARPRTGHLPLTNAAALATGAGRITGNLQHSVVDSNMLRAELAGRWRLARCSMM